jgi:hypothetical protein
MKFTVVFESNESYDLSYGLVFIPCPVWIQGKREIINLNPEYPEYKFRSIKRLIEKEGIKEYLLKNKKCVVVVHKEGHGTQKDFENLTKDLEEEGFKVNIVYF